jgi:hypothetical protein
MVEMGSSLTVWMLIITKVNLPACIILTAQLKQDGRMDDRHTVH